MINYSEKGLVTHKLWAITLASISIEIGYAHSFILTWITPTVVDHSLTMFAYNNKMCPFYLAVERGNVLLFKICSWIFLSDCKQPSLCFLIQDLHFKHDPNCCGTRFWMFVETGTWTLVTCLWGHHGHYLTTTPTDKNKAWTTRVGLHVFWNRTISLPRELINMLSLGALTF